MKYRIVIIGANGFLGELLAEGFREEYQVVLITRNPLFKVKGCITQQWDATSLGAWTERLEGAKAVINLAGKSVNCRYTAENKKRIIASRVGTTHLISEAIKCCKVPPEIWFNASSSTIYEDSMHQKQTEEAGVLGDDFSPVVCKKWEEALFKDKLSQTVQIALRMALVLDRKGGVLPEFIKLAEQGIGGKQGKGKQMVSWVSGTDLLRIIRFLINEPIQGVVNVCSPNPVTNSEFMTWVRGVAKVRFGLPLTRLMVKIGAWFRGTESELLFKSRFVYPEKLLKAGFVFTDEALPQTVDEGAKYKITKSIQQKGNKRGLYVIVGVLAVISLAFRWLNNCNFEQTGLLFVGLPVLVTVLMIKYSVTPKSLQGVVFRVITLFLLMSMVLFGEGLVCVVFAAPIFYGAAALFLFIYKKMKERNKTNFYSVVAIPLFLLVSQAYDINVEKDLQKVQTEYVFSSEVSLEYMNTNPDFMKGYPEVFKIGFPEPIAIEGGGIEKGDFRKIAFKSSTKGVGTLHLVIKEKKENLLVFEVVKDGTHIHHWLTWGDIEVRIEPIDKGSSKVIWTSSFTCDLGPSWYFTPLERYVVGVMNEHLIQSYFGEFK